MDEARQEILNKIRNSVHNEPEKPNFNAPVYHPISKPLDETFKESLGLVNGNVYLCNSKQELGKKLKSFLSAFNKNNIYCAEKELQNFFSKENISFSDVKELPKSIEVGITSCEFLIAHTGSVMVSSALEGGRQLFVYPPIHVVLAKKSQLVDYLETAYLNIQNKYGKQLPSQITLITGPSRTADIEKTLVMGAHGPRELHVFIY